MKCNILLRAFSHSSKKSREDETDGNTFDNLYHTGFIFHVRSHLFSLKQLAAESMLSGVSWVASLVWRSTSCLASEVKKTWETKYFCSTISGGFNISLYHLNFPFESIHKLPFAGTMNPSCLCSLCLRVRDSYMIWQMKWISWWTKKCVCHFCQAGWKR